MSGLGPYGNEYDALLRACGMGGVLDKNRGETGLAVDLAPGEAVGALITPDPLGPVALAANLPFIQKDLLQLSGPNKTNPKGILVGIETAIISEAADQASVGASIQIVATWGSGKGTARAIVDCRLGGQVVLSGDVINVAVRYVLEGLAGFTGPIVRVSANATYGDRPGGDAALTFTTLNTGPLAVGAQTPGRFRIPPYATRVQWVSPQNPLAFTPPAATLIFRQNPGVVAAGFVLEAPAAGAFVAIPNGATNISIRNDGALNDSYRLIYELGI